MFPATLTIYYITSINTDLVSPSALQNEILYFSSSYSHVLYFQLMFMVWAISRGEYVPLAAPNVISSCKSALGLHPFFSPTAGITEMANLCIGSYVMLSCSTNALLMGFRSSSERSDNGTMEDPALTILHL